MVGGVRLGGLLAADVDALAVEVVAVVVEEGEAAWGRVAHLPAALADAAAEGLEALSGADVVPVVVYAGTHFLARSAAVRRNRGAVGPPRVDPLHRDDCAVQSARFVDDSRSFA